MKLSTYTCDGCDKEIAKDVPDHEPIPASVNVVTLASSALEEGTKTVHLDNSCLDEFMDGSLGGNDLFLQD